MSAEEMDDAIRFPGHARAAVREGDTIRSTLEPVGPRESIGGFLARNATRFGERVAFREKHGGRFVGVTWEDLLCDVVAFGRYLASCGIGRGDRVAVVSPNRGEMLVAEFATMCLGAIFVPIFPGYPVEQTRALIEHSGAAAIVLSDSEQLARVHIPDDIRAVVSFEPIARATLDDILGARTGSFSTLRAALRRNAIDGQDDLRVKMFLWSAARVEPDEPCLMMYTSGTSGLQKGVLLTHDNILSQQRGLSAVWTISPGDRMLSYLPWHHSFGGIFEKYAALYNGAVLHLDDSFGKENASITEMNDANAALDRSIPPVRITRV